MDELLTPGERKLRSLLWAGHACPGKYGDDGELQCNMYVAPIDFLRDTPEEIERKIPIHYAQLAKAHGMTAKADRVLAELWDNEKDAAYSQVQKHQTDRFRKALEQSRKNEPLDLSEEEFELFSAIQTEGIIKAYQARSRPEWKGN